MQRFIFFLSMFAFLLSAVFSDSEEIGQYDPTAGETAVQAVIVQPPQEELAALEAEDEQMPVPAAAETADLRFLDERILRVELNAQKEILAVVEEIDQLEDKSAEYELQKEIERIKLDAEIARLRIYADDAEAEENIELVEEFNDHIDYLEALHEPVVGTPSQQPNP